MEGKVLYLHGLGSDGSSRTARMLKAALGEGRVVAPDFDMSDPEGALRQAKEEIAADPSISLVVGTSMGGFVALCLQQIPRIAVNPCTRPSAILPLPLPEKETDTPRNPHHGRAAPRRGAFALRRGHR